MTCIGGRGARCTAFGSHSSYVFSKDLRRALELACAGGFDVLHLEHLWTGWLGWHHAPAHDSSTKVKVQESMALGVPVVTNTEGGEGIPGRDGEHWGFADDDAPMPTSPQKRRKNASVETAKTGTKAADFAS